MTAYIRAADAIRDAFGCAVVIVHHCGIDANRPRGHTALAGAVDAQLSVKRDAADNTVVTVERMKDGPEGDTVTSALQTVDVGTDEDGDAITSCVIVPAEPSVNNKQDRRSPALPERRSICFNERSSIIRSPRRQAIISLPDVRRRQVPRMALLLL